MLWSTVLSVKELKAAWGGTDGTEVSVYLFGPVGS